MRAPPTAATVSSIVEAFASARDVVARLRPAGKSDKAKARLAGSLGAAPRAIEHEYGRGISACGDRFGEGDVEAQTALVTALLRLNTGLVHMIAAFLEPAPKPPTLDFVGLAVLADASRLDVCACLARLRHRLARPLRAPAPTPKQNTKTKANASPKTRSPAGNVQWAMVRPRPKGARKASSSTTSSGASTPKAKSASKALAPRQKQLAGRAPPAAATIPPSPAPAYHDLPSPAPSYESAPRSPMPLQQPRSRPRGRHMAAPIPSIYSFASDSTKLGEIPLHKWPVLPDFDEMERLNGLAAGQTLVADGNGLPKVKRKGLFAKVFRRGQTA